MRSVPSFPKEVISEKRGNIVRKVIKGILRLSGTVAALMLVFAANEGENYVTCFIGIGTLILIAATMKREL